MVPWDAFGNMPNGEDDKQKYDLLGNPIKDDYIAFYGMGEVIEVTANWVGHGGEEIEPMDPLDPLGFLSDYGDYGDREQMLFSRLNANQSNVVPLPLWGVGSLALGTEISGAAAGAAGAAGIVAAPFVLAGDTRVKNETYSYVTYIKTHPSGRVYAGRASGFGTPLEVMKRRDANHHMNRLGYSPAVLDRFLTGVGSAQGYPAIRGREQQLIDFYGGVGSPLVGNSIRGVSRWNPLGQLYHTVSDLYFGPLAPFTGYTY